MKKLILLVAIIGILVVGAVVVYVMRPPAQASQPIEAIPLASATPLPPTTVPTAPETPTAQPVTENTAVPAPTDPPAAPTASEPVIYQIVQAESQVSFSIDELLRGEPFTAVGVTNQVAGEISVDFDKATAQLGVIQVNARTLKTDNEFRDRAISNQILETGPYEYITFTPTAITGIPSTGEFGQPITFQITGDLTIRDITRPATFDVTVTFPSKDRLEGKATATVLRSDYNLVIPSVPQVADVANEVILEIVFVALSK